VLGGDPLRHRSGDALKVQCIGAEVLTVLPLNAPQDWSHGVEGALILQLSEDTDIQVGLDVKYLNFTVRESEQEGIIRMRPDCDNSWIHVVCHFLLRRGGRQGQALAGQAGPNLAGELAASSEHQF
jgi:hypothetical protein